MPVKPLAVQLGEFVSNLRFEALPPEVVDKSKALVNHAVTVAMACHGAKRPSSAREAVITQERLGESRVGKGQGATLWVTGTRVTRTGAAFANGVAVAVNNQCDSYHMLTHPGVLIPPAALATAEGEGRNGRELLTAIVAGYEVQCRCARDFLPTTNARGFRSSPTYGILGCAATVAKLTGLDTQQTINAIALAASFAGSLIEGQRVGAMDADFAEAQAARNGIWAATLAANSFAGAATALEGDGGFYNAFTGNNKGDLAYAFHGPLKADLNDIVADLGKRWETLDVKFKIYPTPGFNQPVIWLGHDLVAKHRLTAEDIEHVTLEMNHLETLYPSPRFPRGVGKDGYPFGRTAYMLAATLVRGDYPVLEHYDPHATSTEDAALERRITALAEKIEIIGEVNRDIFSPRITCLVRDGRRVVGEYNGRELMWDFAKNAKELRRFIPGLPIGEPQYDGLVGAISKLDSAASVDEVVALTLPGGTR
ncbi:MAG TPA: MmgE/PrpD family protein [Burkholderiales bacterium]|nr:MmgE/PrpD family protein [Burkholderiales bacterium]